MKEVDVTKLEIAYLEVREHLSDCKGCPTDHEKLEEVMASLEFLFVADDGPGVTGSVFIHEKSTESPVAVLPDGSAFFTASLPLPKDHWLYAEHDNVAPMGLLCGTDDEGRAELVEHVRAAARYAIRASTMNGAEDDFDPDALVQNMVVGLLGRFTPDGL